MTPAVETVMRRMLLGVVLLFTVAIGVPPASGASTDDAIRIGVLSVPAASGWPVYVLLERGTGIQARCRITVRTVQFEDPRLLVRSLASGAVHALAPVLTEHLVNDPGIHGKVSVVASMVDKLPYYVMVDHKSGTVPPEGRVARADDRHVGILQRHRQRLP